MDAPLEGQRPPDQQARLGSESLAIFDDQVLSFDGRLYSSDEPYLLFMIGMKRLFPNLTFISRLSPESGSASHTIPSDIKIHTLPYYENVSELLTGALRHIPRLWRSLKNGIDSWDVLLLAWPNPVSLLILILSKLRGQGNHPVLVVRQNLGELVKLRYPGLRRRAASAAVRLLEWQLGLWGRDTLALAVGDEVYRKMQASHRHVERITVTLLSRADLQRFEPRRPSTGAPLRILFVGRLEPEKGLPYLIECLAMLENSGRGARLDLVGCGPDEDSLRRLGQRLGLADAIHFHGYLAFGEPLFAHYRAADLFVLPSLSEGFPGVLIEAMAFGVPIVATRVGGIPHHLRHAETAWLIEPGSPRALFDAVSELTEDPQLAQRLSRSARAAAEALTMERQQEAIAEILAKHLRPSPNGGESSPPPTGGGSTPADES